MMGNCHRITMSSSTLWVEKIAKVYLRAQVQSH